jgi:hypothetical protein
MEKEASSAPADEEIENYNDAASGEFAYERDLQNYLAKNLNRVEPGLRLYEEEEISGVEYPPSKNKLPKNCFALLTWLSGRNGPREATRQPRMRAIGAASALMPTSALTKICWRRRMLVVSQRFH